MILRGFFAQKIRAPGVPNANHKRISVHITSYDFDNLYDRHLDYVFLRANPEWRFETTAQWPLSGYSGNTRPDLALRL